MRHVPNWLNEHLTAFLRDRRGGVVTLFAASLVAITALAGAALDYSNATRLRHSLAVAADAAAVAAAKAGTDHLNRHGSADPQPQLAQAAARRAGEQMFEANRPQTPELIGVRAVIDTSASRTGVRASVAVEGQVRTSVMSFVGWRGIDVATRAEAADAPQRFVQVIFLLDISQSMGIGGTAADISALERHRNINCAFACHTPGGGTRAVARNAGIALKIDYLSRSVTTFLDRLERLSRVHPEKYNVSIYSFGTHFTEVQRPTFDLTQARGRARQIDMEVARRMTINNVTADGWTFVEDALRSLDRRIQNVGDGSSPSSMITYVVFISDGLQDLPNRAFPYHRDTNPNYASACQPIKRNGDVEVFAIHTRTPRFNSPTYNTLIGPFQTEIERSMRRCATRNSNYFLATDGPALDRAVESVFQNVTQGPRLTH